MILDANYIALKTQVIKAERRVLKDLGFCVHVKHPHKLIVMYLQVLGYEQNQNLMQMAWNFMNDSLRTDVFVRYNPETIACACIYLTARKINLPLPNHPSWYAVFKVTEAEIIDICYRIMDLYRRHKPNVESLEATVEELKKKYNEQRNKQKPGVHTPPMAVTTVDRNDGSHNAWGGFISRALPVEVKTTGSNQQPSQASHQQQQTQQKPQSLPPQQTQQSHSKQKKSRSPSSRSRSRSRSHTSNDDSRSRPQLKSSRSPRQSSSKKKSSRNYSRSPSSSPRHRKRWVYFLADLVFYFYLFNVWVYGLIHEFWILVIVRARTAIETTITAVTDASVAETEVEPIIEVVIKTITNMIVIQLEVILAIFPLVRNNPKH